MLAIEAPDYVNDFESFIQSVKNDETDIPTGRAKFVLATRYATKERAIEVIDRDGEGWKDYDEDNFHHDIPFPDPLDSLRSLLTSKKLDLNKNYVLIKKVS